MRHSHRHTRATHPFRRSTRHPRAEIHSSRSLRDPGLTSFLLFRTSPLPLPSPLLAQHPTMERSLRAHRHRSRLPLRYGRTSLHRSSMQRQHRPVRQLVALLLSCSIRLRLHTHHHLYHESHSMWPMGHQTKRIRSHPRRHRSCLQMPSATLQLASVVRGMEKVSENLNSPR